MKTELDIKVTEYIKLTNASTKLTNEISAIMGERAILSREIAQLLPVDKKEIRLEDKTLVKIRKALIMPELSARQKRELLKWAIPNNCIAVSYRKLQSAFFAHDDIPHIKPTDYEICVIVYPSKEVKNKL